jgi:hypothetical protein
MLIITEEEIIHGLGYAHDVILDVFYKNKSAESLIKKCWDSTTPST